jgi:hypothetical protein
MPSAACSCHIAGKTTLLQLIAGKYMVAKKTIVVLGQSPFHDLVRAVLVDLTSFLPCSHDM